MSIMDVIMLLPLQGAIYILHQPRVLPWAEFSLALQAVFEMKGQMRSIKKIRLKQMTASSESFLVFRVLNIPCIEYSGFFRLFQ